MNNNAYRNNKREEKYVGAPYNFVPLGSKILKVEETRMKNRAILSEDLLSGEIEYKVTAESEIFIGAGKDKGFAKDEYGRYVIPGSSMRGLIRTNAQILGMADVEDDIDDYRLMYRDVAGGPLSKEYNEILGVDNSSADMRGLAKNVQAGLIVNRGGEYFIKKCKEKYSNGANYLMLSSRRITEHKDDYPFFIENWKKHFMYKGDCIFVRRESFRDGGINYIYTVSDDISLIDHRGEEIWYKDSRPYRNGKSPIFISKVFTTPVKDVTDSSVKIPDKKSSITIRYSPERRDMVNDSYLPYFDKIKYKVGADNKTVTSVREVKDTSAVNFKTGYVLSSGYIEDKKNIYIIPDSFGEEIKVDDRDIKSFKIDYRSRLNSLHGTHKGKDERKEIERFFDLPEQGEEKPVFFIRQGSNLYFGFTPRLRIFYKNNVKRGLRTDKVRYDFVKSIFGMSKESESYRSKVSFSDALFSGTAKEGKPVGVLLASPKPTSYRDYLVQDKDGDAVTYNNDEFGLRGIKQYWLRNSMYTMDGLSENKNIFSTMEPLSKGAEFRGKIRYSNLTKAELGLLLWALYVDKNAFLNIGMGKPFGYGLIRISDIKARNFDLETAYSSETGLNMFPFTELSVEEAINEYKNYVWDEYKIKIDSQPGVETFIRMKTEFPDADKIRYMRIGNKENPNEYQNRTRALPDIEEILGPKTVKLEEGRTYTATFQKLDGLNVRFYIEENGSKLYGKVKITGSEKKVMKEKYQKDMEIKVKCTGGDGDKYTWQIMP